MNCCSEGRGEAGRRLPGALIVGIALPNKDCWLAPERRKETEATTAGYLARMWRFRRPKGARRRAL